MTKSGASCVKFFGGIAILGFDESRRSPVAPKLCIELFCWRAAPLLLPLLPEVFAATEVAVEEERTTGWSC
jgi:hypothetical protein